ncbi:HAMP domain-containing sensor histidine kinase [Cytophagales bacterium LB-30]|uniref:histidine kinase n=1 Tax=Shiella aurantiaca TaxID=3058365 RepID=A0ABT8F2P7_9BACT|nr:HAMP domain-containing sensor histidine kinase [Shiella aurantiaca]MDN4164727.1 HAMP domain-containing sensor histidine kinase [Shiella aurantiaca]
MIQRIKQLMEIGVYPDMDFELRKQVRITNQFSILSVAIIYVFVVINLIKGRYTLALFEVGITSVQFITIYLNHKGRHLAARILFFSVVLSFDVVLTFFLAPGRGLEYHFIICVIIPIILFQKLAIQIMLSAGVFLIFLLSTIYNDGFKDVVFYLNSLALFVLVFYLMKYFQKEYDTNREIINKQVKALELLNEEKNQLLSVASHDLRSPLKRVQGLLSIVQLTGNKDPKETEELISMAQNILDKQSELVSKVLNDFVVNQQAVLEVKQETFLVNAQLAETVESFRMEAEKKHIKINVEYLAEDIPIVTDQGFFAQIFENLISNALKFSYPESEVDIKAAVQPNKLVVSVKDYGQGLDDNDRQKLFQKFQRLSAQPTFGESSTGLGLSIVKKYIDALKGEIFCESEKEKGANFIVHLPLTN